MIRLSIIILILGVCALLLLAVSCSTEDDKVPACGGLMEYRAGDSLVVCIPDSAREFTGTRDDPNHYNFDAYLFREYQIARDPQLTLAATPYSETFFVWKTESWIERRPFLPFPFSHDALGVDSTEFMFLLAEFPEQLGFGWTDTYLDSVEIGDPNLGSIWFNDDPQTIGFDGASPFLNRYRDMLIYIEQ